jgi:glycosyltransferase involved in cell wall biosynthesis
MDYFWLSAFTLAAALAALAIVLPGVLPGRRLAGLPDTLPANPPKLSVIFSALNEAQTLEPALRSLLALEYPALEIIAIDDRSTDETGAILDRIARTDPRLRVLHIDRLPAGWLGKNHALQKGGEMATGDYLLFTDADVHFERRALRQAVGWCERERVDHLAVIGEFAARGSLLASQVANAFVPLFIEHPVWLVRRWRRVYLGVGMFNLVRAAAYRRAGGHASIPMEVLDDLMLGKLMQARGFRQDGMLGTGSVRVDWYPDFGALAHGLEKNGFAIMDYNLARVTVATALFIVGRYWPVAGLFVTTGAAWAMNVTAVVAMVLVDIIILRSMRLTLHALWWWPVSALLTISVLWRSVFMTLRRGGVAWRGTLYPLAELRRAHARPLWVDEPQPREQA